MFDENCRVKTLVFDIKGTTQYKERVGMHNKKTIQKFSAIILISMLICLFFSVTSFAEETAKVRYVTSREVNLVFDKYLENTSFDPLSDSNTVTKSELYNAIRGNFGSEDTFVKKLPTKIVLDLTTYPEELITENNLFMYIDEFEKVNNNQVRVKFVGDSDFWLSIILIMLLFAAICKTSTPHIPDYREKLWDIDKTLISIKEAINSKKK